MREAGKTGVAHRLTMEKPLLGYLVYAPHGWSGRMSRTSFHPKRGRSEEDESRVLRHDFRSSLGYLGRRPAYNDQCG
jgi:hypothetical protein